jgi:hypothetical protein
MTNVSGPFLSPSSGCDVSNYYQLYEPELQYITKTPPSKYL